jgi:PAS domain S-box-containing protein
VADALWIVGISALSAVIAASIGTAALAVGGVLPDGGIRRTWTDWSFGNFAGTVMVAPLLLAWICNGVRDLDRRRIGHLALALAAVAGLGKLVFLTDPAQELWRTWHIFPALVWAALAFQVRGASAALVIAAVLAAVGVSEGIGPFMRLVGASQQSAELLVQQFVGLTGSTILILAAGADERRGKNALHVMAGELQRQTTELETLYREAPVGMVLIDRDLRVARINEAMAGMNGIDVAQALDRPFHNVLPHFAGGLAPLCERVFAASEPIVDAEISGGAPDRLRHWIVSLYPIGPGGRAQAVSCVAEDVTERREAEEREHLLAREVDHRAKNLLAVVQGVVKLTRADTIDDFVDAVTGRIQSLGRAHSLLADSRWEGVDLRRLAIEELAPFGSNDPGRVRIEGPALHLRPAAAQSFALVLHELATNAAKYGALATADGRVHLAWRLTAIVHGEDGCLDLHWRERGGPLVAPPTRRGFGSSVIRNSVERQLGGAVVFDWQVEGLVCRLSVPARQLASPGPEGDRGAAP